MVNFIEITPNGAYVYAAGRNADTASVIDTSSQTVVATVTTDARPDLFGMAITPDGSFLYISDYELAGSGTTVSVVATATNTLIGTVSGVGPAPEGIAITPDGAFAYVANAEPASVSVIATATNSVVATVGVGDRPTGIAITHDGASVYVVNSHSDTVSVIDAASSTVSATVNVGDTPFGIAITPPPADSDADGVADGDDQCPNTTIPEAAPTSGTLGYGRFALETGSTFSAGRATSATYTTTDTAGCSCEQIAAALGLGLGQIKFGCSSSVMQTWVLGLP